VLTALVISVIAGGIAVIGVIARPRQARLWSIADMPEQALGRIVGVVRAVGADVLEAPLSGRPCLFYAVYVANVRGPLADEQRGLVFEIDDGTGIARIEATIATSMLRAEKFRSSVVTAPTQRHVELLERHGYRGTFLNVTSNEAVVQVGDRIAVVGFGRRFDGTLVLRSDFGHKLELANDRRSTRIRLPSARLREH
jgi:hypothetical protein